MSEQFTLEATVPLTPPPDQEVTYCLDVFAGPTGLQVNVMRAGTIENILSLLQSEGSIVLKLRKPAQLKAFDHDKPLRLLPTMTRQTYYISQ